MREPTWSSILLAAVISLMVTSGGHGYGGTAWLFSLIVFYKLDGLKAKNES